MTFEQNSTLNELEVVLKKKQKSLDDEKLDEPKIAMSFHRHRLRYYGVAYFLIILILYVNFDG